MALTKQATDVNKQMQLQAQQNPSSSSSSSSSKHRDHSKEDHRELQLLSHSVHQLQRGLT